MDPLGIAKVKQEHKRLFGRGQSTLTDGINAQNQQQQRGVPLEHDNSADATAVVHFMQSITHTPCSNCRSLNLFDAVRLSQSKPEACNHKCPRCGTVTCIGCGRRLLATSETFGNSTSDGRHFTWHCDQARLAVIWLTLCGYDNEITQIKSKPTSSVAGPPKKRERRGYVGIGYTPDDEYAYDPSAEEVDMPQLHSEEEYYSEYEINTLHAAGVTVKGKRPSRSPSPPKIDPEDQPTIKALAALSALLPSPTEHPVPTAFDNDPPQVLASMLRCSSILDKAVELVRNNSLEDVTQRSELYQNLITFIRTFATGSAGSFAILHKPRSLNRLGHNLAEVSYRQPTRLRNEQEEVGEPLATCLTGLIDQSKMLLEHAASQQHDFQTKEAQQMITICTSLQECAGHVFKGEAFCRDKTQISEKQGPYLWQRDMAVSSVSEQDILAQYHYANEAKSLKQASSGRMRRLINEITSLKANLPPNIFVRYADTRPDIIKAVIVGPEGTPYEHGLFEFDIWCPPEYPQVAPKMFFKTTGGGRVYFNPNLYSNGMVCLSLLGTWHGETWQPAKSTLLQVLVSIQAMIFCAEPWCNEPGREYMQGTEASMRYSRSLWSDVIKYAMLEWIDGKKTPTPTPARIRSHQLHVQPGWMMNPPVSSADLVPILPASLPTSSGFPGIWPLDHPAIYYSNQPASYYSNQPASYHSNYPPGYPPNHAGNQPPNHAPHNPTNYATNYATNYPPNNLASFPADPPPNYGLSYPSKYPSNYPSNYPPDYPPNYPPTVPVNFPTALPTSLPGSFPTSAAVEVPAGVTSVPPPEVGYRRPSQPAAPVTIENDVFRDIAKLHFEHNHDSIIKTVNAWIAHKQAHDQHMASTVPKENLPPPKKSKTHSHASGRTVAGAYKMPAPAVRPEAPLREHLVHAATALASSGTRYFMEGVDGGAW